MQQWYHRLGAIALSMLRLGLVVSLTLAGVSSWPTMAIAADTWLPSFQADQRVYVDPQLATHPDLPVDWSGLPTQLAPLLTEHAIEVYLVATEQGDEPYAADTNWAVEELSELIDQWEVQPGFPYENYLVVLWVRQAEAINKGWVAANPGDRLFAQGITPDLLSDPDGPVITALRAHMPQAPDQAMLQIVQNVNQELAQFEAQQALQQNLITYVPLGGCGAIAGGSAVWLFSVHRRRKRQVDEILTTWKTQLENANQQYVELYDDYYGFLKDQSPLARDFAGQTLTAYQTAITDFSELTVRLDAANARLQQATTLVNTNRTPLTGNLDQARDLLSTVPFDITGQELSPEMRTLFGDVVQRNTYSPPELLAAMADRFTRANQILADIVEAVFGLQTNLTQLAIQTEAIAQQREALAAADLEFAPYAARFAELEQCQADLHRQQQTDPLAAYPRSQQALAAGIELLADLQRAIALKQSLVAVEAPIARAVERAEQVRQQAVDYHYPLAPTDSPAPSAQTFTLDEPEANPDPLIAAARESRQRGLTAVLHGQLQEAELAQVEAIAQAEQAVQMMAASLAAKQAIETQVPAVRQQQAHLQADLPAAAATLAQLQAEFLPHNFADEPGKLQAAIALDRTLTALWPDLKATYDRQHYLQAQQALAPQAEALQTHRDRLQEIPARQAELQRLRQDSRDRVDRCQTHSHEIAQLLSTHAFTTSAETEAVYQDAIAALNRQHPDVHQEITDWVRAQAAAQQLQASLSDVEQAIQLEAQTYSQLQVRLSDLAALQAQVQTEVQHQDVRAAARDQLTSAQAALATVQQDSTQPKSDWNRLLDQVNEVFSQTYAAQEAAQRDRQLAEAARAAINQAESALRSADRSYGYGVQVSLSTARSYLHDAKQQLQSQDYDSVASYAQRAQADAESAEKVARQAADRKASEQRSQSSSLSSSSFSSSSSRSSSSSSRSSRSSGSRSSSGRSNRSGGGGY